MPSIQLFDKSLEVSQRMPRMGNLHKLPQPDEIMVPRQVVRRVDAATIGPGLPIPGLRENEGVLHDQLDGKMGAAGGRIPVTGSHADTGKDVMLKRDVRPVADDFLPCRCG